MTSKGNSNVYYEVRGNLTLSICVIQEVKLMKCDCNVHVVRAGSSPSVVFEGYLNLIG